MPAFALRPRRLAVTAALALAAASPALAAASAQAKPHHRAAAHIATACRDAGLWPTASSAARVATATLCLVNEQRARYGRPPLVRNAALDAAATGLSQDMVTNNFFGHVSSSGATVLDRLRTAGYITPTTYSYSIGENIAAATGTMSTPSRTVTSWMNSAGHRANILSSAYRDTGMGVVPAVPAMVGSGVGATYTQDFGSAG